MSEKSKNKREWVKTAAIIFLSVMLVLTFFSQTIMNYSLPIVTAQYINSGQISAKVRGSGKIESADLYNVQIPETRDIQSIEVKKGDKVEKDQVMIHLKDKESDELKTAKEELEKLQVDYKKALLDGGISDFVYYDAVAGREDSTDGYRAKIKAGNDKVKSLEAQLEALNQQKRNGSYDLEVLKVKIESASAAMSSASAKKDAAKQTMADAKDQAPSGNYGSKADADAAVTYYEAQLTSKEAARNAAASTLADTTAYLDDIEKALQKRRETSDNTVFSNWLSTEMPNRTAITGSSSEADIENLKSTVQGHPASDVSGTDATGYYADEIASAAADAAYNDTLKLLADARSASASFANASASQNTYNNAQSAYNSAVSEYDKAKAEYDNLIAIQANAGLTGADLDNKIAQIEAEIKKAQADLDQLLKDIPGEIELNSTARVLKEKQEELQKLLDNAIGATIDAPIAGTIVDVNVVSGGKAEANATVVTIQPENKGFTLSVPVTAEQAKKVSVGSIAEVQNSWYYNDITVELKKIQNDPANPGKSKLLVFDVSGDVSAGQELSISVGSKSQGYDMIVPNSAIRSDNNGKFILIVESKSSPIGNRYYASRVDIEVLAEDDTSTAISAPIDSWQYVITAANKPVEAGKQVRLQD